MRFWYTPSGYTFLITNIIVFRLNISYNPAWIYTYSCEDPESVTGSLDPSPHITKNSQSNRCLSNTGTDLLKNLKVTKPESILGRWWSTFSGIWILEKSVVRAWLPRTNLSGSAHVSYCDNRPKKAIPCNGNTKGIGVSMHYQVGVHNDSTLVRWLSSHTFLIYFYSIIILVFLTRKRGLVALLLLSFWWCLATVHVMWLFLTVPWVGLQFVIVVFPDHTQLLFTVKFLSFIYV